jgi:anti-sigma regulatory factor (Ser/Thr protein kinase)
MSFADKSCLITARGNVLPSTGGWGLGDGCFGEGMVRGSISLVWEVDALGETDLGAPPGLGSTYSGHMTIRPGSAGLSAARERVRSVARELAVSDEDAADLLLAVGEALSNAYLHGTPDPQTNLIYVGWRFAQEVVTITVKDEGPGFTPREVARRVRGPALLRGQGLRLMREGADEVYFEFDNGARVNIRKKVVRT